MKFESPLLKFQEELESTKQKYRVIRPLGEGGNAQAYQVMGTKGGTFEGQSLAAKVLVNVNSDERMRRFKEELEFLSKYPHPGLVPIHDSGTYFSAYGNHPFYICPLYADTLRDIMRTRKCDLITKLSYSVQLSGTITFLQKLPIPVVHRDIKPDNIFMNGQSVILGDFGLVKTLRTGSLNDTDRELLVDSLDSFAPAMPINYRTPDIVDYVTKKIPLTPQTDVYQLGLVLYELFHGDNPQSKVEQSMKLSPVTLGRQLAFLPGVFGQATSAVLHRLLVMEPSSRLTAEQALRDLSIVLQDALEDRLKKTGEYL